MGQLRLSGSFQLGLLGVFDLAGSLAGRGLINIVHVYGFAGDPQTTMRCKMCNMRPRWGTFPSPLFFKKSLLCLVFWMAPYCLAVSIGIVVAK